MAETCVVNIETNGYRNVIVRATFVSVDGTGITNQKIFDASSAGAFGVNYRGQNFYPGLNTVVRGLDYDVQNLGLRLQWEATTNQDIMALGNAPEDFDWTRFGGIRVPAGLAGATGSILVSTYNAVPQGSFSVILYLRKNVP